jgi:hypothetical protein
LSQDSELRAEGETGRRHESFIGLENINPDNLAAAKKRQKKITNYRKLLLASKAQGIIITFAGYILGFPADTPETIRRDIAIIKNELPIDLLEFFCLTPCPAQRIIRSCGITA